MHNIGGPPGQDIRPFIVDIYQSLPEDDLYNVQRYMDICRNTQSADHFRKKTNLTSTSGAQGEHNSPPVQTPEVSYVRNGRNRAGKTPTYQYDPLVGDPCYRYNKCAKEKFFRDEYLAFLFVQFTYYFGNEFILNKQWRVPGQGQLDNNRNLTNNDHEKKLHTLKLIFWEFVKLSLKTLKKQQNVVPGLWQKVSSQI